MKHLFLLIPSLFSLLLCGCDQLEYKGDPQYILYVQDEPANYKSLTLSITTVELFNGSQWINVEATKASFNLMSLTGGSMLKVASAAMPEGKYTSLRVTFNQQNIVLNQLKANYNVTLLPENQALTIPVDIELKKDLQYTSILDISAAASIIKIKEGEYQFKPVTRLFDISTMGVLNFMVVNDKKQPIAETILVKAYIPNSKDTIYTYINSATAHGLLRLPAATYDMIIAPDPTLKYNNYTLRNIQIVAGQPLNLPAIVLTSNVPK